MDVVPRYKFEAMVATRSTTSPTNWCTCSTTSWCKWSTGTQTNRAARLYEGVPHTERTGHEGPDVVSIYRFALCEMCDDIDDLAEEVYVTVIHEVAHAAGIDDDRLHQLGWG